MRSSCILLASATLQGHLANIIQHCKEAERWQNSAAAVVLEGIVTNKPEADTVTQLAQQFPNRCRTVYVYFAAMHDHVR